MIVSPPGPQASSLETTVTTAHAGSQNNKCRLHSVNLFMLLQVTFLLPLFQLKNEIYENSDLGLSVTLILLSILLSTAKAARRLKPLKKSCRYNNSRQGQSMYVLKPLWAISRSNSIRGPLHRTTWSGTPKGHMTDNSFSGTRGFKIQCGDVTLKMPDRASNWCK